MRNLDKATIGGTEDDGWGAPTLARVGGDPRRDVEAPDREEVARIQKPRGFAVMDTRDDGWGDPAHTRAGADPRVAATELSSALAQTSNASEVEAPDGGAQQESATAETHDGGIDDVDDGWGGDVLAEVQADSAHDTPLPSDVIAERTTSNRIDLADNVRAIDLKASYDGYLDIVMHGDESGTQAYVDGQSVDFTLAETANMVESSPGWEQRPIRLLSCSTGRDGYAQELADRLDVPVYAPNGTLHVLPDGETFVESPDGLTEGAWRRFEPRPTPR